MAVIVTVVEPTLVSKDAGIVKFPVLLAMVNEAVLPVELLTPLKLYVTVNVPLPKVVEFTVTVEVPPRQAVVAAVLRLLTLTELTVTTALPVLLPAVAVQLASDKVAIV